MRHPLRVLMLSVACSAALAAQAQAQAAPNRIDLPAGELTTALNTLAKQSGTQLVYRADQLKGQRTAGVQGRPPPTRRSNACCAAAVSPPSAMPPARC